MGRRKDARGFEWRSLALEERIREAYLFASGGAFDVPVRLANVRQALAQGLAAAAQEAIDDTLRAMAGSGAATLLPSADPRGLGPDDERAAVYVGNERRDLVRIPAPGDAGATRRPT